MSKRKPSTRKKTSKQTKRLSATKHAVRIIQAIYRLARSDKLLDANAVDPTRDMLRDALRNRDTGLVFDWLAGVFALQGISDSVAIGYMERNGSASWKTLSDDLVRKPTCPKLASWWHYDGCAYSKTLRTCARPDHFWNCPVPTMRLRNGRLNVTAWSLFLFIRDVADGDLVKWLGQRIRPEKCRQRTIQEERNRLLEPLSGLYGVAKKVLSMALSDLLLAAPPRWRAWNRIGGSLIVIDSLVHNNLSRTGILARYKADHHVGPACYQPRGCADIIDRVAWKIGSSPRHTTHALWRYCSIDGFNVCNGNRINDRKQCGNIYCRLYGICDRRPLHVT